MTLAIAPEQAHVFEKRTFIKSTIAKLRAFHESPDVFGKLAPPPIFMQIKDDQRTSLTDGDLKFTLWFGFIPIAWHARHQTGPTPDSFADLMVDGPMLYWRHEHIFVEAEAGCYLVDRVTLAHHAGFKGLLTRLMFDGIPLQFLFFYRHLRTKMTLE